MSSFSEQNLVEKLDELNSSQQSIQTLSLWLIHYRRHSKQIVDVWMRELKKAKGSKKLTFVYLANDIIQNSKNKGPEYSRDYRTVLPDAFRDAFRSLDKKAKGSLERVLDIWLDRKIYDVDFVTLIRKHMSGDDPLPVEPQVKPQDTKKTPESQPAKQISPDEAKKGEPPKKKKKVELSLREEIELEMQDGPGDPPTAEELIKVLSDLENSASSDAAVRERIAALPPEVSDVSLLEKLSDTAEADALMKTVDDACTLLTDYNTRLAEELTERKRVAKMLHNYIVYQKEALNDSEQKLAEYKKRLEKVDSMHKELESHVQSLPNFTLLPSITGGLAPLPSAGDLFSSDKV